MNCCFNFRINEDEFYLKLCFKNPFQSIHNLNYILAPTCKLFGYEKLYRLFSWEKKKPQQNTKQKSNKQNHNKKAHPENKETNRNSQTLKTLSKENKLYFMPLLNEIWTGEKSMKRTLLTGQVLITERSSPFPLLQLLQAHFILEYHSTSTKTSGTKPV